MPWAVPRQRRLALAQLALGLGAPAHGWTIELDGLGTGFFYRVFAGAAAR